MLIDLYHNQDQISLESKRMKGKKKINNNRSPCAVEKTYLRRSVLWDKRMRRSDQLAIGMSEESVFKNNMALRADVTR